MTHDRETSITVRPLTADIPLKLPAVEVVAELVSPLHG